MREVQCYVFDKIQEPSFLSSNNYLMCNCIGYSQNIKVDIFEYAKTNINSTYTIKINGLNLKNPNIIEWIEMSYMVYFIFGFLCLIGAFTTFLKFINN